MSWFSEENPLYNGWNRSLDSTQFPDPFTDYASFSMPQSISVALRLSEFAFVANGTYREATRRLLSYFITDVEAYTKDQDSKERWVDFLENTVDIKNLLHITGLDMACYGNSFVSLIPKFTRHLICGRCRELTFPLRAVMDNPAFRFQWSNFQFRALCPKCKFQGAWDFYDMQSSSQDGFRVRRWNPHHIEILHEPWTDECQYIWKIPEDYRNQICEGKHHVIESAPKQVLEAVKHNKHLMFERGFVHHMREESLAGIVNRGWGISRVLTNFRQLWYVQVLHRYNEALALDYIIPFRLITPEPGDAAAQGGPIANLDMGDFVSKVHAMLRKRASNPIGWNTLPYPVKYQAIGGDARALAPSELLTQGNETMLNAIGMPAELYRGTVTMQVMPAALRLFEASNTTIPHNYNKLLRFVVNRAAPFLKWDTAEVRLMRVTHADDANRQLNKLQLMAQGDLSKSHGARVVGADWREEVRQMMDDQAFMAEEEAKLKERLENMAQMQQMSMPQPPAAPPGGDPAAAGGAPPGGNPSGQGGQQTPGMAMAGDQSILSMVPKGPNANITPEEQFTLADTIAKKLSIMPESQRLSDLRALKQMDPNLHAIVTSRLGDIRNKASIQGRDQVLAASFGKQGASKAGSNARLLQKMAAAMLRKMKRKVDI